MQTIIVLDKMSEKCEDCCFANFDRDDCYCFCMAAHRRTDRMIYGRAKEDKPLWCPLQSLPEEITGDPTGLSYDAGFTNGWNKCLKEITSKPKLIADTIYQGAVVTCMGEWFEVDDAVININYGGPHIEPITTIAIKGHGVKREE